MIVVRVIDNLSCIVVVCDICEKRIEKASDGGYGWEALKGDVSPYFFHKGNCFEWWLRSMRAEQRSAADQPLTVFPIFLERNLQLDREEAEKTAAWMSAV